MKSLGYVHTPITEHHRWEPISRRSISTGRGTFNRTTRLMLHQMRWRKPPRQIGLGIVAWIVSLLVHLVMLVAMLLVRPPEPYTPTPLGEENAIQVRFIEAAPKPPPPPVPVQPRKKTPEKVVHRNLASTAPHKAPVARPARPRPRVEVQLAAQPVHVPAVKPPVVTPRLPQVKPAPQAPPAPKAPAISLPPPEKLVMEPSKMALPPPKVVLEPQTPVHASPSPLDQPIEVTPARPEVGVPKIRIRVDTAGPVATQNVAPVQPAQAPAPRIDVGSARPQQQIQAQAPEPVRVEAAPQVQDLRAPEPALPPVPEAPTLAPRVEIHPPGGLEAPPDVRNETPVQPQVQVVEVPPAPASVPPVARPLAVPDTSSWARSHDDRFSTTAPGHGTAAQPSAGRGSPEGVPDFIQRMPQGNTDVMTRHYKGLSYKPTIFDQYWAPNNQDFLTEWLQKLVDVTSYHGTLDMGHGLRIHCGGWLLGFGCGGDPPGAPLPTTNDRRLNMAPAKPLVPGLGASAPAPVQLPESSAQSIECETARISGAPPPPGCGGPASAGTAPPDPWKH